MSQKLLAPAVAALIWSAQAPHMRQFRTAQWAPRAVVQNSQQPVHQEYFASFEAKASNAQGQILQTFETGKPRRKVQY